MQGQNYNVGIQNASLTFTPDSTSAKYCPTPVILITGFSFSNSGVGETEVGAGMAEKGVNGNSQTWVDLTKIPETEINLINQSLGALLLEQAIVTAEKDGAPLVGTVIYVPNLTAPPEIVAVQTRKWERALISNIVLGAAGNDGKLDTNMKLTIKDLLNTGVRVYQ
jgi:hypothetical protein